MFTSDTDDEEIRLDDSQSSKASKSSATSGSEDRRLLSGIRRSIMVNINELEQGNPLSVQFYSAGTICLLVLVVIIASISGFLIGWRLSK